MTARYGLLARLLPYLRPYWPILILGGVLALLVSGAEALIAWMVKPAMDEIFLKRDVTMLRIIPLALLGAYLLKGAGRFGQSYLMASVGERVIARIRRELYAHIQSMPLAFFASLHSAELMTRVVTDVNRLARLSSTVLVMAVRHVGTIAALLTVMFLREWVLALIAIAVFPVVGVAVRTIGRKLYKINRRTQQKIAELNVVLQESFTGTKIVKAFGREGLEQVQGQELLAELPHQHRLLLHHDELAFVHYTDAIGHLLGLIEIMRRQDDGDAGRAQGAHDVPHVLAQLDIDAGRRLVEEQDLRLVRKRLGDQHPPLHAARERHHPTVPPLPQRQLFQHLFDMRRIAWLAEQTAAEAHRRPYRLEGIRRELLRHEPDQRARRAVVADDVVTIDRHAAFGRIDDAADDADQRRLACAVWTEKSEDFAAPDVQVDAFERMEAGGIGFGKVPDGDDGLHGNER